MNKYNEILATKSYVDDITEKIQNEIDKLEHVESIITIDSGDTNFDKWVQIAELAAPKSARTSIRLAISPVGLDGPIGILYVQVSNFDIEDYNIPVLFWETANDYTLKKYLNRFALAKNGEVYKLYFKPTTDNCIKIITLGENNNIKLIQSDTFVSDINVDSEIIIYSESNDSIGQLYLNSHYGEIFNDYKQNIASGSYSHAEGSNTKANGEYSHAEGVYSVSDGTGSHTEGCYAKANGDNSHAEGDNTIADGHSSHAEGSHTITNGLYSHAEGEMTKAEGDGSHAEGLGTFTKGSGSHSEGIIDRGFTDEEFGFVRGSIGEGSHSEGGDTSAKGEFSHAEGYATQAIGKYSHAEGERTEANGENSHAEGNTTLTIGDNAHAEGINTVAGSYVYGFNLNKVSENIAPRYYLNTIEGLEVGDVLSGRLQNNYDHYFTITAVGINSDLEENSWIEVDKWVDDKIREDGSSYFLCVDKETPSTVNQKIGTSAHAEGYFNKALASFSHAEGCYTVAAGRYSHAEGYNTKTSYASHAEGLNTFAKGQNSHAEGSDTISAGANSHSEGVNTNAEGYTSHAEGQNNSSTGDCSHAEGINNNSEGYASHAEGQNNSSTGGCSHAEGSNTTSSGYASHAEGSSTISSGDRSHAEGENTRAIGAKSHAEGGSTEAIGNNSHAEGRGNIAEGVDSHAEGQGTKATQGSAHAEGTSTEANGYSSHAEGRETSANGGSSHAEGRGTIAAGENQHVQGKYNLADLNKAHIVGGGDGPDPSQRRNIHTIDWDGNAEFAGDVYAKQSRVLTEATLTDMPVVQIKFNNKIVIDSDGTILLRSPDGCYWDINIDNFGNITPSKRYDSDGSLWFE